MDELGKPKTLYVGNLDQSVTEDLIMALFNQMGPVKGCKIIREPGGGDPYCFVEFTNHTSAFTALSAMNKRMFLDKEMKVNWATNSAGGAPLVPPPGAPSAAPYTPQNKPDTSSHHHIFVGDLSPEIETENLRTAFAPFGDISDCRVVKDLVNGKSKGYGFVSYVNKPEAQAAIEQMNGQWLGSRAIRTNWATRKPPSVTAAKIDGQPYPTRTEVKPLNYDDVFSQASSANCTVYCGGLTNADDNAIRRAFSPFGRILEVRYFKDKGYAFIRYDIKDSACNAIVAVNGTDVNGCQVKCSWGKENGGVSQHSQTQQQQQQHPQIHQQVDNFGQHNPQLMQQQAFLLQQAALQQQHYYTQYMYNPQLAAQIQQQQQQQQQQQPQPAYGYPPQQAAYGYPAAAYEQPQGYAAPPPQ